MEPAPSSSLETAHACGVMAAILQTMQQSASTEPSSTFAGILAALAVPTQKRRPALDTARDTGGLEDDVATLSYERALRAHSRFRTPDPTDRSLTQPSPPARLRIQEAFPSNPEPANTDPANAKEAAPAANAFLRDETLEVVTPDSTAHHRNLKSARITMWLSPAESLQLRTRAAEAGLTVSAYLRSCTVEAESLRAQVKDTLAQMRAEAPTEDPVMSTPPRGRWFGWLHRNRPELKENKLDLRA